MRASRLVSALLLLQARGRMTARQLADELDVSVRTVYRDMESLGAAGIPPHLAAAVHATWNQQRILVTYQRWAVPREVNRTIEPWGVVLKAGRWYLVAGGGDSVRTYRISQIRRLVVLDERFDRPEGFDLTRYWEDYLREFDARRYEGEAVVRMSPTVFERLPHLLEPAVVRHARDTARPTEPDGWVRVVIPIESIEYTTELLLRLGTAAEVLEPPALRRHLAETVAQLARTYASD